MPHARNNSELPDVGGRAVSVLPPELASRTPSGRHFVPVGAIVFRSCGRAAISLSIENIATVCRFRGLADSQGPFVTIRPIIRFPDPRLRQKAEPIIRIDDEVRTLARDLTETMHAAPGIGITAPHIGVLRRLVVIQLKGVAEPHISVNPEIVWSSPETIRHVEGSVSMPGVTDELERSARVWVRYTTLDGEEREDEAEGLMAVCLQHEIDQLDGIFWIDRLSRLKRDRLIKKFDKLQRTRA